MIDTPIKTKDGEYEYICPECLGFDLVFDKHSGSVSCHDCGKFDTYGGKRSIEECKIKKTLI